MTKPHELEDADMILGLCERFHCLPSQLENESAEILKLIAIRGMGHKQEQHDPLDGLE